MKLLVQEAARRGIEVEDAEVSAILDGIERDAGGAEALAQGLQQNGISREDLRRGIEEKEVIRLFMEQEIQGKVSVSDEDLATFYQENIDRFEAPEMVHARHIAVEFDVESQLIHRNQVGQNWWQFDRAGGRKDVNSREGSQLRFAEHALFMFVADPHVEHTPTQVGCR